MGLIDSGVDAGHPVFRGVSVIQKGFGGSAVLDAHGTATAALMMARGGANGSATGDAAVDTANATGKARNSAQAAGQKARDASATARNAASNAAGSARDKIAQARGQVGSIDADVSRSGQRQERWRLGQWQRFGQFQGVAQQEPERNPIKWVPLFGQIARPLKNLDRDDVSI